jgi:modulator of FtsH protease HflK
MNWDWEKLRENQDKYEKKQGGGGGTGMPPRPPQVDELFNWAKNFKKPGVLLIAVVVLVAILGSSCVFTVKTDEVGVIQRFGKYVKTVEPGLNFKLPAGIENVTKVKIKRVYQEEFGLEVGGSASNFRESDGGISQTQLMLTGDLNVAVVPWVVQYRISDPFKYLFKIKDVKGFLNSMSEATMRTVVGDRSINEVLSSREQIAFAARDLLQKEMDEAQSGITVTLIELKKTNVAAPVQSSFNEVNQAIQEKEQTIYKAKEEYNNEIPQARGEARRLIQEAEGYTIDRINRAQGDASKYLAIFEEYAKAKEVTKTRLYLEAMMELYPELGAKYIIDSDQKGVLPFLNMTGESPVK